MFWMPLAKPAKSSFLDRPVQKLSSPNIFANRTQKSAIEMLLLNLPIIPPMERLSPIRSGISKLMSSVPPPGVDSHIPLMGLLK